jgi:hypothetical protein
LRLANDKKSAYAKIQSTRPQTIGYALADSPAGQAAWIYEKLGEWTDSDYEPEREISRDEMLDNISLYWLTNTAASSARLYYESFATDFSTQRFDRSACRREHFPRRIVSTAAIVGRAGLFATLLLERSRPRRTFRGLRAARPIRRGAARRVPRASSSWLRQEKRMKADAGADRVSPLSNSRSCS